MNNQTSINISDKIDTTKNLILQAQDVCKSYPQADGKLDILTGINLKIHEQQTISIVGSSGSGKSTLLHILAGLDAATNGEVIIAGKPVSRLTDQQICKIRNQEFGFIYQFHHLLPEFNALENTLMPLIIAGNANMTARTRGVHILTKLGLFNRLTHFPSQLSGGERQRVAIARALINNPRLVFADEPTGNLDNNTAHQVLDIFFELQQELGTSLVIVTHDTEIANRTEYKYRLHLGNLQINNT